MHGMYGALVLLLSAVVSTFPVFGIPLDEALTPASQDSHSRGVPSSPGSGDQDSAVVFKDGRLSVSVRSAVLAQVLEQISGAADVAIIGTEALSPEPLSIKLQDLSLEDGLHRILKNYDVFFYFSAGTEPASQLKAIWVYPRGKGREYVPVPPEKWASTKEVEAKLRDPDSEVRARAIEALIERSREKAHDSLLRALRDKDAQVRTRALSAALNSQVPIPEQLLVDLMSNDGSPEVRFLALDSLADSAQGKALAWSALNDPDPHVQNRAREILEALEKTDMPPSNSLQSPDPKQ